jgi:uncharacterized protein involved in oxidation of intracellular sulfur
MVSPSIVLSTSNRRRAPGEEAKRPERQRIYMRRRTYMKILMIISTDDAETIYNAMRLANVGVKKGDEISVFMLGKGVLFERSANEQFNVMEQVRQFAGDFYV